jgi:hypothetical protein
MDIEGKDKKPAGGLMLAVVGIEDADYDMTFSCCVADSTWVSNITRDPQTSTTR